MRDGYDGSLVLVEVLFQPVDAFRAKVVGRLIQEQYVRFLQQQAAQCHAAAFTSGEHAAPLFGRGTSECIHGTFQTAVEVPCIRSIDDVLQFSLTCEELVHLILVLVVFRQSELLVYLLVFGQCIHDVLHALLDRLDDRLVVVELRFLGQVAHRVSR